MQAPSIARRIAHFAVMLIAASAAPLAIAGSTATAPPTVTVEIQHFVFVPREITVAPGAKVVWINRDETPHTATARDKSFDSKALDTNDRYTFTFSRSGDVEYDCAVHPYMTGVVHVQAR